MSKPRSWIRMLILLTWIYDKELEKAKTRTRNDQGIGLHWLKYFYTLQATPGPKIVYLSDIQPVGHSWAVHLILASTLTVFIVSPTPYMLLLCGNNNNPFPCSIATLYQASHQPTCDCSDILAVWYVDGCIMACTFYRYFCMKRTWLAYLYSNLC